MKKTTKIIVLTLAAGLLAGCSHQAKKTGQNNSDKAIFQKISHKKGHLSSKNLTPKMTASIITVYAAKKYDGAWDKALDSAEKNGLTVKLEKRTNYSYMTVGTGYSYMISNDCGYTLTTEDNETKIYIYGNGKKLGSATVSDMVDYLNDHNGEDTVKKLAKSFKIVDDSQNGDSDSSSSSSSKSHIAGDGGLLDVPAGMQGTWYTYEDGKLDTVTFNANSITYAGHCIEFHRQTREIPGKYFDNPDSMPNSYKAATKNWNTATFMNIRGIKWLNIRGWVQSAGDGAYYGLKTEKGQTVLVSAGGAEAWADAVYWRNLSDAKKYKDTKFSDIKYY